MVLELGLVDGEEQHTEAAIRPPLRPGEGLSQAVEQEQAAGQPRERIVEGVVLQPVGTLSECLDRLLALVGQAPGIADGSLQEASPEPSLDKVISRAGFHRVNIGLPVVVAGQQDDRRGAAGGNRLAKQLQPGPRAQMVIQKAQLVAAAQESRSGRVVG